MRVRLLVVPLLLLAACGDDGSTTAPTSTTTTMVTTTTAPLPQDPRSRLERRLADELDPATAATVVGDLSDQEVQQLVDLAGGDVEASPLLSYTPTTVPDDEVGSLWIFAFGYRFAAGDGVVELGETPPGPDELVPGPVNEAMAQAAADFVAEHPVPIIAQWEVARALEDLGVEDVISVEPVVAPDGTVTYLSTAGVAEAGLQLAADAGIDPGHAGVLCFADHAVRCILNAESVGLTADVPEGVDLPADYDPESGQAWTRSREAYLPTDLLGRVVLAGS